jgi:large subunit ribosomal protein L17
MRHQSKKHTLGKAQDQRKALLRSLATELILHGEIKTTMARAKALKPYAESIISLAKQGTLHSRRLAAKYIFDKETGKYMNFETGEVLEGVDKADKEKKAIAQTVLRKLFAETAKNYANRNGGYTRIYRMPPRRGDASEMALIQLV